MNGRDRLGRSPSSLAMERQLRFATAWDANHDQVYTCAEWKKFVTDIFNQADRNHDGFVDATEFKSIQDATPQFKDASLGYFDDNGDGRLSRAEFVDKPNPFFLQFDKNHDCKVTLEEIMEAAKPTDPPPRPESAGPSLR
jgi:Ca2+-binding EF-hand superfamily protein